MLNLKKLNLAFCFSAFLVSGATFANDFEPKTTAAVDVLTIISAQEGENNLTRTLLGCTTTPAVCSRVAGDYGYPYFYAQRDSRCSYDYPFACYGAY